MTPPWDRKNKTPIPTPSSPKTKTATTPNASWTSDSPFPRYTPAQYAAFFLDFYIFLTTFHYSPSDLKIPPPGGWPNLTREAVGPHFKSDFKLEVLRQLPHMARETEAHLEYKCQLVDYTVFGPEDFVPDGDGLFFGENAYWDPEEDPARDTVVCIAKGWESGGLDLYLNVHRGEIIEEVIKYPQKGEMEVGEFLESLKEKYRSLKLIPCRVRLTILAENTPEWEGDGEITEADFVRQEEELKKKAKEKGWCSWCRFRPTHLDVQYLRQIYRRCGWPKAFRREEAERAVEELMAKEEEPWFSDAFDR
ncbi:hypothetical protein VTI74DRAFT_6970 [Chaetomium olivicolor]